uniref:DUF834 domain-containing protein n=1 Tax=Oryza meridionalis TaxID=40149 RepID=A0A0E0EHS8_9ORYZ
MARLSPLRPPPSLPKLRREQCGIGGRERWRSGGGDERARLRMGRGGADDSVPVLSSFAASGAREEGAGLVVGVGGGGGG